MEIEGDLMSSEGSRETDGGSTDTTRYRGISQEIEGDRGRVMPSETEGGEGAEETEGCRGRPREAEGDRGRPRETDGGRGRPREIEGYRGRSDDIERERRRSMENLDLFCHLRDAYSWATSNKQEAVGVVMSISWMHTSGAMPF